MKIGGIRNDEARMTNDEPSIHAPAFVVRHSPIPLFPFPLSRVEAAVLRANVVVGAHRAQRGTLRGVAHAFLDQLADHGHEPRVRACSGGALHRDAKLVAQFGRFGVQVVEHFDVVGDEADRHDDKVRQVALRMKLFNAVAYVRLEPWLLGRAATALVDQLPLPVPHGLCHQPARFVELCFVLTVLGHRQRDAVRRKHDEGLPTPLSRDLLQAAREAVGHRFNEAGVVEEHPGPIDPRCAGADLPLGFGDVLAVLPATGVRTKTVGKKGQRVPHAVAGHPAEGVRKQGVPVAVSPVDRQLRAVDGQFLLQSGYQFTVLLVDRAHAAEPLVVVGHFQHPLAGHVLAT